MDTSANASLVTSVDDIAPLSYDDTVPYDEQLPAHPKIDTGRASLADRIGTTKVYLISEAATGSARIGKWIRPSILLTPWQHSTLTFLWIIGTIGKRKHEENGAEGAEDEMEEDADTTHRDNAILFQGPPISHLPTSNIFAYATHFDAHPIALEWINDSTCILVFPNRSVAHTAHRYLSKSYGEEPSEDGFTTAKPIPITLWPPEERINKSLGKGEGLKGVIRMRWGTGMDVKKKGAKNKSEFYKKYGTAAGKDGSNADNLGVGNDRPQKRRRRDEGEIGQAQHRAELDDELDAFLAEEKSPETNPPRSKLRFESKMRSDYLNVEGKSLLERTSVLRAHPVSLASRMLAPLPRRAQDRGHREWDEDKVAPDGSPAEWLGDIKPSRRKSRDGRGGERHERPKKTQEDLDAELDAFLNDRD